MSNFEPRGRGRGQSRGRGCGFSSRGSSPASSRGFSPTFGRGRGRGGSVTASVFNPGPAQIDSHLSNRELDALTSELKKLDIKDRVIRKEFGKRGTAVTLRANYFALKYPDNAVMYDHPLKIDPEVKQTERRLRTRLFELFEQDPTVKTFLHGIAHDKMQRLIAIRPLPANFSVTIQFYEAGQSGPRPNAKTYTIKAEKPRELKSSDLNRFLEAKNPSYDPLPIVSAFNLIMTTQATRSGISFGKNRYFFPPNTFSPREEAYQLSEGLEAWKGFFASVRPTYKSLMMNVSVCMSAFIIPNEQLSNVMVQLGESSTSFLRRVRVTTKYLGYRKKSSIKAFGPSTARKTTIQCDEMGGTVSVEQYFQKKYNIRLRHADDIPVINIGNREKDTFVPAEVCEIEPGQPYGGTLSEKETANMIRFACRPPDQNADIIAGQGLRMLGLIDRAQPISGFDINVSAEMAIVPARVLNAPRISYSAGNPKVNNGSWNLMGIKFSTSAKNIRPAVIVLSDNERSDFRNADEVRAVYEGFRNQCGQCGLGFGSPIGGPTLIRLPRPNGRNDFLRSASIEAIERSIKSLPERPSLILVFLSNTDRRIYHGLKKLCDVKLGISTVCMQSSKVRNERGQAQYFANIAMKVNAKLGGVNHSISTDSLRWMRDAMLVGMDITHPGKGSVKGTPSIAAVVASCDSSFIQYPASMRLQESRKEMITEVKDMIKERLQEYQKKNGKLPERVIVFRDGVSEGQFDIVLKEEVPEIKAAFRSFKSYSPKLTVIICGKRHHTRFFPTSEANADKTSNTKAGTVVDSGVTSIYYFDFYLQAHAGLQGTVRATHYSVIYDENKLGADDIQQGVNDISYLWARATKSVSLIPPAYWAYRACKRGRAWLHGVYPPPLNSREMGMDEKQIERRVKEIWGGGIHDSLKSTMFYL